MNCFRGRSVVVTGGGGSIGFEICRRVVQNEAARLTLVSLTEAGLYNALRALRTTQGETVVAGVLGSAGDVPLMTGVLAGVDIVVHAGAHKHVPICESNPLAAIENNAIGTWRLIQAARQAGVGRFCLISSDKAVHPTSIMGRTKRLAERIVFELGKHWPAAAGLFAVRFGNVMDSAGSVLPLWREQIAAGGPVTVTDERCERFFMTIDNAVDLVCKTLDLEPHDGLYVFDMGPPVRLVDLAAQLIQASGRAIALDFIGLRPGEKLTEELHFGGTLSLTPAEKVYRVDEANGHPLNFQRVTHLAELCRMRETALALDVLHELTSV